MKGGRWKVGRQELRDERREVRWEKRRDVEGWKAGIEG